MALSLHRDGPYIEMVLTSSVLTKRVYCISFGWCAGIEHVITQIFAALSPQDVQAVSGLMVRRVPRTLEALLLHALPPAAAELLTQKLEQADAEGSEAGRAVADTVTSLDDDCFGPQGNSPLY